MPNDYLPDSDDALLAWFNNFQSKLTGYAVPLGLNEEDVNGTLDDYKRLQYVITLATVFRAEAKERTAYKEIVINGPLGTPSPAVPTVPTIVPPAVLTELGAGIVPRVRLFVQRIKLRPAYSDSVGQDLGIIAPGAGDGPPPLLAQPLPRPENTVAVVLPGSHVQIKWVKKGFTGVIIESQRATETIWTSIGMDTSSPYLDSRDPLVVGVPELRRYRLRYLRTDDPIGDYSDVITVTTTP